jgi:hypothetical protein
MRTRWQAGLALAAALGLAHLVNAQRSPAGEPVGQMPAIVSVALELVQGERADRGLLLVTAAPERTLPQAFEYPYETGTVTVSDTGRNGDRRRGDGIYSALVPFNAARFQRDLTARLQRLPAARLTPPPALSTRFTPLGGNARRLRQAAAAARADLTAIPAPRESLLRDSRQALAAIGDLRLRRSREAFRIEPSGNLLTAQIFGIRVPIDIFFTSQIAPGDVIPDRSLVITDLAVVKDATRTYDLCHKGNPNGIWTFKHLVTQMANTPETGITPEQFVWNWLSLSQFPQETNNIISAPRPAYTAKLRDDWVNFQQGGSTTPLLDLDKAPFRLLAIVARPDLGSGGGGYGGGSAGEMRFVFGVVDPAAPCSAPLQSTVIFEYRVDRPSCSAIKSWTQSWFDLSDSGLIMGGSYNQALEQLTQQVVVAGANASQLPNRNAISQVRTNDLVGGPWTLFEYRLVPNGLTNSGNLDLDTVKQTPSITFHSGAGQPPLAAWLNANQAAILANGHTVPTTIGLGVPFLGADAPTNNSTTFTWTGTPGVTGANAAQVLSNFSTATCNGCHDVDTGTLFTHIKPRPAGAPAQLSTFMVEPNDPNNLIEDDVERRQRFMADSLNSQCFFLHMRKLPKAFVH